jgi:diguanylate cyclase (GGDEF)-like protein
LEGIAQQVLVECRRVIPFSWYQFDLLRDNGSATSWRAGADGLIEKGGADPPPRPAARPGIHRRAAWKVVERRLKADGRPLARLRLWVVPRELEPTSIELLDSLLPQVGSAVQRALLDHQAKRDPLTGLADRGVLESRLELAHLHCKSEGGSMAVIMCDLDLFKKINDRFGHDVGDRALVQVAGILEAHRREDDLCCRFGGEEFAVILERTDGETALRVAERLRAETRRTPFVADDTRVPLSLSAGVAAYPELFVRSGKELLILADEALLEAKRRGRNRALLHLGKGRFRTVEGKVLEPESPCPDIEPPTLFA